jgi:hypothetical protein
VSPESGVDAKPFSPALAESMDIAFEKVCRSLKPRKVNEVPSVSGWSVPSDWSLRKSTKRVLGAKPGHEIATRAATKIAELVKAGVSDPDELWRAVLNDFKKR